MIILLFTESETSGVLRLWCFIGMDSGKEHCQDAIPQDPVIMGVDVALVS